MKLLWLVLITGAAPCPGPTKVLGAVGDGCSKDADCQAGLFCETRIPGGDCTKRCDDNICPMGSDCINVVIDALNESDLLCLKECPCRTGWMCVTPDGANYSVCVPKT